jgi:hypothetical protein
MDETITLERSVRPGGDCRIDEQPSRGSVPPALCITDRSRNRRSTCIDDRERGAFRHCA